MKATACMFLLVTILIVAFPLNGCSKTNFSEAEMKGDSYYYGEATGNVYSDYSQNFNIKIEQWKCYYDAASAQDRILLSLTIKNKTGRELDNFNTVIGLNDSAADLVASGILVYDQFEPCDLIPEKSANGASYAIDFLVESDAWLTEIHADKFALLDKIRFVTLDLSWDGSEETIELQLDPLTAS